MLSSSQHVAALAGAGGGAEGPLWASVSAPDAIGACGVRGQLHGLVGALLFTTLQHIPLSSSSTSSSTSSAQVHQHRLIAGLVAFSMQAIAQSAA